MTNSDVLKELKRRQGKRLQKELAAELGISQQHLVDVFKGRRSIGPTIVAALGLEERIEYVKAAKR